jgi:hypothetical protein
MNITNTMCRLSELSQWEIDSLVSAMPSSPFLSTLRRREGFIKIGFSGTDAGFWNGRMGFDTIVTYTQMMQLLGKTMQFTKSDLKAGLHFVKSEDGRYWAVLDKVISYADTFVSIERYSDNLKLETSSTTDYDIVAVYVPKCRSSIGYYLKGQYLTPIWERTKQTPAQKEMEVLQAQAKALQEQITKLQGTL